VPALKLSAIWDGMTALVLADLSRLFFVAAPFTLLPSVAVQLLLPPLPATVADITGQQWLFAVALPALLGNFAQLVVTALLLRPDITPRSAFAVALPLWPVYLAALLLAGLPVGLGILLLVLPGLWVYARLVFPASAVMVAEGGTVMDVLKRSWALSEPVQGILFLFVIVALFGVIGILLLANGAGAALDVVARAIGLDAVGRFLFAVSSGMASTIAAIAGAAASVFVYRELAR
jgi:hypothetical protein